MERQRLLQSSPSASSSGLLTPNSVMSAPPSPSIRQDQGRLIIGLIFYSKLSIIMDSLLLRSYTRLSCTLIQ